MDNRSHSLQAPDCGYDNNPSLHTHDISSVVSITSAVATHRPSTRKSSSTSIIQARTHTASSSAPETARSTILVLATFAEKPCRVLPGRPEVRCSRGGVRPCAAAHGSYPGALRLLFRE